MKLIRQSITGLVLAGAMMGAWSGQAAGKGLNTRHGTILTLEDISVSFDGFKALNDLNLYIGVGELRCIIG
ncbi:MAG: hypothetical protein DSZ01_03525, partial [Gammaproteobacteria bacterium]